LDALTLRRADPRFPLSAAVVQHLWVRGGTIFMADGGGLN
jgi:hypothetical protein